MEPSAILRSEIPLEIISDEMDFNSSDPQFYFMSFGGTRREVPVIQ
jgi:hypothetical protein